MRCKQSGKSGSVKGQPVAGRRAENKETEGNRGLQNDVGKPFKTPNIRMENTARLPSFLVFK
jgi:hypothetical protein